MASTGVLYGIIGALGVVVVGGGLYIAKQEGVFGPSDPLYTGAGTYAFRARIRNVTNGAASAYSIAASIGLH